jgi:hypothetical protein
MMTLQGCSLSPSPLPHDVRELVMTQTSLPQPHEQRKVEELLINFRQ